MSNAQALFEPGDCVSYRLRRAARKAASFYDAALRPIGLRNTQFTVLGALDHLGEISIGDLSAELATDATTLNRNLAVLIRRGLVEDRKTEDGRIRNVRITREGRNTFKRALPVWQSAQHRVLEAVSSNDWANMRTNLREIEAACDQAS